MALQSWALSHIGGRESQEDSYFEASVGETGLYVVADGMGGHLHGAQASAQLTANARALWERGYLQQPDTTLAQASDCFFTLFKDTNAQLLQMSQGLTDRCGTTASLLFIKGNQFCVAHVGDSRIYVLTKKLLRSHMAQLSVDHVNAQGQLTSALGMSKKYRVFTASDNLDQLSRFLLCSDGLTNAVSVGDMKNLLTKGDEPAEQLVRQALHNQATDNVSALVVSV